jgi:hypothetical protein
LKDAACIGDPLVLYRNYGQNTYEEYEPYSFLIDHYNVVEEVFNEQKANIDGFQTLRKETVDNFVEEALNRSVKACWKDEFSYARKYMEWAKKISGKPIWNRKYFEIKLRLILGARGISLYRNLKRKLYNTK